MQAPTSGWSLHLGRIAGTDVRVHATFWLLLAFIGLAHGIRGGAQSAIDGVVFVVLIFACVLAHEFGHVLAARRYGIRTRDVMLWPFGGVASMERMPEKPGQELVVALAGPAVNVVIAGVLFFVIGAQFDLGDLERIEDAGRSLIGRLAAVNVALVVFNLIPAFPMDGGRVLRALLSMRLGPLRATQVAARVGQALALVMALAGFFVNPMLILIGIFVFFAAGAEVQSAQLRSFADGLRVGDAMLTQVVTLPEHASLIDAVDALVSTSQKEFPVTDAQGGIVGVLTREGLILGLQQQDARRVADVMVRDVPVASLWDPLEEALRRMEATRAPALIVIDPRGEFAGLLTSENIGEMMLVEAARPGMGFVRRL